MNLADKIKAIIEVELEKVVMAKSDAIMNQILAEITKLIPGSIDDMAVEALKPKLLPAVKAELLKLVEQISTEV